MDLSFSKDDGRVKLYVVWKALNYRRSCSPLFHEGDYHPLEAEGRWSSHVCAFERRRGHQSVVVAVPRFLTGMLTGTGSVPFGSAVWGDTRLVLSGAAAGQQYRNIFTGEIVSATESQDMAALPLAAVFASFPVALLERLS
jgi:(1->4)-alpha-D-glucan 1-alpha-D-glucosylmutase